MESNQQTEFNWITFLERRDHTIEEMEKASQLAYKWPTCACGTLCFKLKRYNNGMPIDYRLASLGRTFYREVHEAYHLLLYENERSRNYFSYCLALKNALDIFHEIEKHTAFLLLEQSNDNHH